VSPVSVVGVRMKSNREVNDIGAGRFELSLRFRRRAAPRGNNPLGGQRPV
jgi:hypothetical protein